MSRIGKKPIAIPKGVTVSFDGNTVKVQGPKGKLDTPLPFGIKMEQKDGTLLAVRENDSQAAIHGLARALVNNAVEGVTKGWTRELEIVGIGYRAELKGKATVVFSLGYSHPIEYPLPAGIEATVDPKQTKHSVARQKFSVSQSLILPKDQQSATKDRSNVDTNIEESEPAARSRAHSQEDSRHL